MCGICGQFNFGSFEPVQRRDIESMAKAIRHRGPDDEGYHVAGPLGLGFRRLSIIDLAGGAQPLASYVVPSMLFADVTIEKPSGESPKPTIIGSPLTDKP